MRNTLAVGENDRLVAVWLDKRASRAGYKVYSAFSNDGGISWGDNYNIIDEWGTIVPQWTPAVASNGHDKLLAVWMDAREDEKTIWMSELNGMTWSSNTSLSGDAEEAHSPVIAYSPDGTLHAAWIEKELPAAAASATTANSPQAKKRKARAANRPCQCKTTLKLPKNQRSPATPLKKAGPAPKGGCTKVGSGVLSGWFICRLASSSGLPVVLESTVTTRPGPK